MKYSSFLLAVLCFSVISNSYAVRVDKVRYCRLDFVICNGKTQSDYSAWEEHGVPKKHQKATEIARYSSPRVDRTRNLIFVADGQILETTFDILASNVVPTNYETGGSSLSGKPDGVANAFFPRDSSLEISELDTHLISQLLEDPFGADIRLDNSFIAASWNASFRHGSSSDTANRIVNAHYDWLKSKFIANNLNVIILAGHSRGGALVTMLGQKFKAEFPDIPVMVYTAEPVTNPDRSVPPISTERVFNPVQTGNARAYRARFEDYYPNQDLLRVVNILTGFKFIPLDDRVRPMAQRINEGAGGEEQDMDLGWFRQRWYPNQQHQSFVNPWAADFIVLDISNNIEALIIERNARRNPTAKCRSNPTSVTATSANGKFSDTGSFTLEGPFSVAAPIVGYNWTFFRPDGNILYTRSGRGVHSVGVHTPGSLRAELTVTNGNGRTGSTICSFSLRAPYTPPKRNGDGTHTSGSGGHR